MSDDWKPDEILEEKRNEEKDPIENRNLIREAVKEAKLTDSTVYPDLNGPTRRPNILSDYQSVKDVIHEKKDSRSTSIRKKDLNVGSPKKTLKKTRWWNFLVEIGMIREEEKMKKGSIQEFGALEDVELYLEERYG